MANEMDGLHFYRSKLVIEKHRLDDELEIQAELLQHISERVVKAKSRTLEAKDVMELEEAKLYAEGKEDYPKATVSDLQSIVSRHSDRKAAWIKYQVARHDQELWEGLHEAWKARGFALRALVDLRLANYYTSDSASTREDDHEANRGLLHSTRKSEVTRVVPPPAAPRRRTITE